MDARTPVDPNPSWLGYSIGRWDKDTLVVETIGFNNKAPLDISGHPRSESMRVTERYRRRDVGHLDVAITFDDPVNYTRPFTINVTHLLQPDTDILESFSNENRGTGPTWRPASELFSSVFLITHRLQPGRRRVDVHGDVRALAPRNGAVPVTFTRGHDDGVPGFEIVGIATIYLYANPPLDDEEPLRAGVPVPVRSSTVGECHSVHADWNAGLVMGQTLDRRPAEKGRRIDRTDWRVTRSKDTHRTIVSR